MVKISSIGESGIFLANEDELQFFVTELPKGGWGVVCTECRNVEREPYVWTFPAFPFVLIGMREHRREHFGLLPGAAT
jgi:hypothetical protein